MTFVLGCAGIAACAVVRDAGKKLQSELWLEWGGNPALQRLRWRDASDTTAVAAVHRDLQPLITDVLPNDADELSHPEAADAVYERAVRTLRQLTRNHDAFPLVFAENIDYGFRRNALGLRRVALVIAVVTAATAIASLATKWPEASWFSRWIICLGISIIDGWFWWRIVRPQWVKSAANEYADRLIDSIQSLRSQTRK